MLTRTGVLIRGHRNLGTACGLAQRGAEQGQEGGSARHHASVWESLKVSLHVSHTLGRPGGAASAATSLQRAPAFTNVGT